MADLAKPGNILDAPKPTKKKGERSLSPKDIFLTRYFSPWMRPDYLTPKVWRAWVLSEPVAMVCRETLIANIVALDWAIVPRDSDQRDELKSTINHYTKLIEQGGYYLGTDYTGFSEWILQDMYDLPFGAGCEIGRYNDREGGRVAWLKPLDGGTLYPTLNHETPVIQYYNGMMAEFPAHAIARAYISPRPEIHWEGWGMAPPEKVFFALQMLFRGDQYYANLLLENPPAGILDLGDMEKASAVEWVDAFRAYMHGQMDSYKIPVLYEHTKDAKFIDFGKVPNDIMYDRITLRYAAFVAAAYGISLSDIGLQTTSAAGETLAGSIRQERRSRRTGFARGVKKLQAFYNSFLPKSVMFKYMDFDDEVSVALGRARLATITALSMAQDKGQISAQEARIIELSEGLLAEGLPETLPPDAEPMIPGFGKSVERPGALGNTVPPSAGGEGEVKSLKVERSKNFDKHVKALVTDIVAKAKPLFEDLIESVADDDRYMVRNSVYDSMEAEDLLGLTPLIEDAWKRRSWLRVSVDSGDIAAFLEKSLKFWCEENDEEMIDADFVGISKSLDFSKQLKEYIGRAVLAVTVELMAGEDSVDRDTPLSYDNVVDKVHRTMMDSFDDFVASCLDEEVNKIVNTLRRKTNE